MDNDYTERQEGPRGQRCDLLTRVPYDRQRVIEIAMSMARSSTDQQDAALRGLLWGEPVVEDTLTHEMVSDIGRAGAEVIQPWRERAVELYNAWYKAAMPGPKGRSRTASPTLPSGTIESPSGTSEPS